MASISLFNIVFSKESASYYTGELLDGDVVLHLDDSLRFNGIMLRIHGKAKASIQIQADNYPRKDKVHTNQQDWQLQHLSTKATEEFIDNAQYIYGDGSPLTLDSGQYNFPFHFHLPKKDLPTSFEGDRRCYIRYSVTATLDLIDEKDRSVIQMFTLLARIDVNNPDLQVRIYIQFKLLQ